MRGVEGSDLKVLGVTVLTSLTAEDVAADDHSLSPAKLVEHRVRQALDAGVHGVVASPHEAARHVDEPELATLLDRLGQPVAA